MKKIQMANKYMKKCLSLTIREMQIKIIMKNYLTLIRMTIIKNKKQITNAGEDVENRKSDTVDEM
jgi:hypothetical protein